MNRFTYLLTVLGCLLIAGGCQSNLEEVPISFLSESNSFTSAADATTAINAVYDRARVIYQIPMIVLGDLSGDDLFVRPDGDPAANEVDQFKYTASTNYFDNFYTNAYVAIDRSNRVIENVPKIAMDTKLRDQIVGEAKFMRALHYFNLVRAFGDVPLVVKTTTDVVNVKIPRDPADKVYQQIIQDLLDAEKVLPVSYTAAGEIGRATVGAAKSILAKVYLTRKDWTNAAAKAKEVINAKTYSLVADFRDIFTPEKENGPEHIFSIQFSCIQPKYGSAMAENFAIYFSYPINLTGGSFQVTDSYANSFVDGDYRKQVAVITQKTLANGTVVMSRTGPHLDKYWDPNACGAGAARNNFLVIRYADVLLMYAEALNEVAGPGADAYAAINQIRARARKGVNTTGPQDLAGLTQAQFRDALLQERSWELAGEGHRRWDLLRTGKLLEAAQKQGYTASEKYLLFPIPTFERDANPALTQNPGF
ncbi:RagB/SusD family nutrient uptake outer membrane protein [Spirosoma sp. HMF4905]|uniref:RagB/SusD family nutrient uptake outer membrane protein n=1 Tax=Spirosoma arboris TaxID=2682092 RepID=A0A7K1S3Y4_9BACT|nr:RagB/SusD family nutrient uptake outer membrane protein [Spirosoma arboris]MVM28541.1 RagB/SusD family nutrient uptake outer membrane protein [Spirosoma arboris]